jgi:hypothetical protein
MTLAGFFREINLRLKQHIVLLSFFHLLERTGIKIVPYYLTLESMPEDLKFDSKLKPIVFGIISPTEIETLFKYPEFRTFAKEAKNWSDESYQCFGMWHNGEIVAYCWFNIKYCVSDFINFNLQSDEAYLFRTRTAEKYRGINIAPLLRYSLYTHLNKIGRTKYYSITEYFNKPAINFKRKLRARQLKLFLYINIYKLIKRNIILKEYE